MPAVEGAPNVLPVDSERGRAANNWHTDVTFVLNPPQAGTLRSITLPPYGGETLIAGSAAAYRNLPEPLRALADTLALFDNRITQHYAIDNYDGLPRRLNRVAVAGDVPVGIEGKESYSIAGDASHYTSVAKHTTLAA